jgi:hypothetical protein
LPVDLDDRGGTGWVMNPDTGIAARSEPRMTPPRQPEACGRCHSRRGVIAPEYEFGKPLTDTHQPALLEEPLYFPDGQIRGVLALFPGKQFPSPEDLLGTSDEQLRAAGLSRNKTAAVKDIAAKTISGVVPDSRAIRKLPNEEILERLTSVRGVGPWTVEMLLMFTLGREDAIVFVTSVSSEMASPQRGEYCVSKAGLSMAAKLFAVRLAPDRIPVYEVRPGIIATDMTAGVKETYDKRIAEGLVPEGRWGQPEDVGRAVAALLRGDVAYATGTIVNVDGGLSIPRL